MLTLKTMFFAALGVVFVLLSLFFMIGGMLLVGEVRPFSFNVFLLSSIFFAMAGGCFWLALSSRAWGSASYIPRAVILTAVALFVGFFGFIGVRSEVEQFGNTPFAPVVGLFFFSIVGGLLWGALPRSWRRRITSRRKPTKPPS